MKPAHWLYAILLSFSVGITALSQWLDENFWNTITLSIGCGGISSVSVAWLIDIRNYRQTKKENNYKFKLIMDEYVQIFQRLLLSSALECHGLHDDNDPRSFKEWLALLCDETKYSARSKPPMPRRCERLSATIYELQNFLERFQSQSALLILSGYPNIENILKFFSLQRVHCWGTLAQLNMNNYKTFCETTYILFDEFSKTFPEYAEHFPEKYTLKDVLKWNL